MALLSEPAWRIRAIHDRPPHAAGAFVLYWMIGARRPTWNLALDRAIDWADELSKPLVVLEALRCDYQWASDRFHQFVIDGMRANAAAFADAGIDYYPYLEPAPRAGRGLLQALADAAAVVVTDRTPVFDLAGLVEAAARHIRVRFEEVDGYGIVPLDAPASVFPTAYAFRRYLQRSLREFLPVKPRATLTRTRDRRLTMPLTATIKERWPSARLEESEWPTALAALPVDHSVGIAPQAGGHAAAGRALDVFMADRLRAYDERSHPDADVSSGLSPYLHFGHISAHEVLHRVLGADEWTPERLGQATNGSREGWWGVSAQAEGFLDQLVTWRELGGNATRRDDYTTYQALPAWARATLEKHAADERPHTYSLDQFARADTHDPLWNAAQRELALEGRLHNYMRMLWGKKILEWTHTPREALEVMVELNNRYALDGRDPNSYSGIFWVLGRYDRPWGPERQIYGTVRYMTSESAARKLKLKEYLRRWDGAGRRLF
ncbi:MAG: deoxyribodipyrimidine photolyase [Vicinamibacterales bacterium]